MSSHVTRVAGRDRRKERETKLPPPSILSSETCSSVLTFQSRMDTASLSSTDSTPLSLVDPVALTLRSAIDSQTKAAGPSLVFSRMDLPIDFVHDTYPDVHYPRKLASFTSSAHLNIQANLGKFIAAGRSGVVFEVNTPTTILDSGGRPIHIPPLVCKFAAPDRNTCVAREAWFYDEMQTIQGMAIPRCFGLFEAEIPDGFEFIPYTMETYYEDRTPEERAAELLYERVGIGSFQDTPANWEIRRRLKEPQRAVLLLLERLGGQFLPLYTKIPDEIREDAYAAYDVLAEAGILHCDVRLGNLLWTLDSALSLPGIPSPFHDRVLKCRIIDFELSCKTGAPTELLKRDMYTPLYDLMYGLPSGDVLNQKLY